MTIDINKLRKAIMDYYGTAMTSRFPMAVIEVGDAQTASQQKLIEMAQQAGLDLEDFIIEDDYER